MIFSSYKVLDFSRKIWTENETRILNRISEAKTVIFDSPNKHENIKTLELY